MAETDSAVTVYRVLLRVVRALTPALSPSESHALSMYLPKLKERISSLDAETIKEILDGIRQELG